MKKWFLRIAVVVPVVLLFLAGLVVLVVGPWPTYESSHYETSAYFAEALDTLDESAAQSDKADDPGRLQAGWAERDITPPVGTPMGGYSDRPNEKHCTGIHDPLHTRAMVFSDGEDTAAIVASDILMTTINIAEIVWDRVEGKTGLTRDDILFTSSHNHCGPGGYMPGLVGEYSAGEFDENVVNLLANGMAEAVIEAWESLEPAAIAHVVLDEPEWIRNRTNVEGEDSSLRVFLARTDSGKECYGVRYSAHPNVMPDTYLEITAEYPGVLAKSLAERSGKDVMFIGGAVGAMGPDVPAGVADLDNMIAMGTALADRVLNYDGELKFETHVDVQSAGGPVGMPSMQARPVSAEWRFSPLFAHVVGLPTDGWIQGVRAGDIFFLGLPYDSGGVIAAEWAADAKEKGIDLWVSSHCVSYCGYLNPSEYYLQEPVGYDQHYEWRLMDWFGPDQEAQYRDLKDHLIAQMFPER